MAEVIGVRFKEVGKVYYFAPGEHKLSIDDIISGELYNPEIITPTDEIIKQCQTSINNGQWVC